MKLVLSLLLMIGLTATAQEKEKPKSIMDSWPALKEFHTVMSQTFHPSEEGNLEPIKKRSGELFAKALVLVKSEIPKKLDKEKMKDATTRLYTMTEDLDKMIKAKASDSDITGFLSKIHDVFHEIVGLCKEAE